MSERISLEDLNKLLDLANKHGVHRFEMCEGKLIVEYDPRGPPTAQALADLSPVLPTNKSPTEEMCACGHALTEHNGQGECYYACETARCATESNPIG